MNRKFIISLFDHAFFIGIPFLINIILIRYTNAEVFGTYTLFYSAYLAILGIYNAIALEAFTVFASGRLNSAIDSYYADFLKLQRKVFYLLVLLSFFIVFAYAFYANIFNQIIYWLMFFIALPIPLFWKYIRVMLYLKNLEIHTIITGLIFFLSNTIGIYVLHHFNMISAYAVFLIFLISFTIPVIYGHLIISLNLDKTNDEISFDNSYWLKHFGYSKWILASAFVIPFSVSGYFWFLEYLSKTYIIAEVKAMWQIGGIFQQVMVAVFVLLIKDISSLVSEGNFRKIYSHMARMYVISLFALSCFYLIIIINGKDFLLLIYGENYSHLSYIFKYLFILSALQLTSYFLNVLLKSLEMPWSMFYGYLFSAISAISLGFYFTYHYETIGVFYGLILSEIILLIVLSYFVSNAYKK